MSQRDPLNLRSLPERPVPQDIWTTIDQRLHGPTRRTSRGWAVAAAVALAFAVVLWWDPGPTRDSASTSFERYRSASMLLEQRVDRLRDGAIELDTLLRAGQIEQRLAVLDRRLMRAPDDAALWRQRLSLLDELARLYAGRPALAQLAPAVDNPET